jgi:hypothetical protein
MPEAPGDTVSQVVVSCRELGVMSCLLIGSRRWHLASLPSMPQPLGGLAVTVLPGSVRPAAKRNVQILMHASVDGDGNQKFCRDVVGRRIAPEVSERLCQLGFAWPDYVKFTQGPLLAGYNLERATRVRLARKAYRKQMHGKAKAKAQAKEGYCKNCSCDDCIKARRTLKRKASQ